MKLNHTNVTSVSLATVYNMLTSRKPNSVLFSDQNKLALSQQQC